LLNLRDYVATARGVMRSARLEPSDAVEQLTGLIPEDIKPEVIAILEAERAAERSVTIRNMSMLEDRARDHVEWLPGRDQRDDWYYWPRLRQHLLSTKDPWPEISVDALDDTTERILAALEDPRRVTDFDTRGLVVGFVQSGKTANYTALMAKAADAGYRLFIVLSGIHDSLRQQTQRRLNAELVGGHPDGVPAPTDEDHLWVLLTTTDLQGGDFRRGTFSASVIGTARPTLIVVKKNVSILKELNEFLDELPSTVRNRIAALVIDDEADQASVNIGGNRAALAVADPAVDDDADVEEGEPEPALAKEVTPSSINEQIRDLITNKFAHRAYIGYTATPFANVLIDGAADDREVGADIYPRDFIIDLPPPPLGYYGGEAIFGRWDDPDDQGMNVTREVPPEEVDLLTPATREEVAEFQPRLPESLKEAMDAFVLAMAARHQRGQWKKPCTMLIHTSYRRGLHERLTTLVQRRMDDLANEWRYPGAAAADIVERLEDRWESDFRPTTRDINLQCDVHFDVLRPSLDVVLGSRVEVRQINSSSDDELDFELEPSLKAIVVGGNRLSRGLTVQGLTVSYFVRRARNVDTLMQMERWCGFRPGYVDLTRIYATPQLLAWLREIVGVEAEMRASIARYELMGATPRDFSVLIPAHSELLLTDRLKMRKARTRRSVSYSGGSPQTTSFLLDRRPWLLDNQAAARRLLKGLGPPTGRVGPGKPLWTDVAWEDIVDFLEQYQTDPEAITVASTLLKRYVRERVDAGHLLRWNVAVMGQGAETHLGSMDLDIEGGPKVNMIMRSRVKNTLTTIQGLTSPSDLFVGLPAGVRDTTRRDIGEGGLLIYPISRLSGWRDGARDRALRPSRVPLFDDPEFGADVIGIAMLFPVTEVLPSREYIHGTAGPGPA
jgi:hypothetical protein